MLRYRLDPEIVDCLIFCTKNPQPMLARMEEIREFHIESFAKMAEKLCGYTDYCVISFIDLYEKTKRNFPGVREVKKSERIALVQEFVRIGKKYGITIRSCCEGTEFAEYGVDVSGCMTKPVIERAPGRCVTGMDS